MGLSENENVDMIAFIALEIESMVVVVEGWCCAVSALMIFSLSPCKNLSRTQCVYLSVSLSLQ